MAPTTFQTKNFLALIPITPHIGLSNVRIKGTKRAKTIALPGPYLRNHFSVATTFTTRVLNTTVVNDITGCSLGTNQITLPAGSYIATAFSPFRNTNLTKIRLYNVTDSTNTAIGQGINCESASGVGGIASVQAQFVLTGSKTFAVQYYCQTATATFGLGRAVNAGISEIYTTIQIQKFA